MDKTTQLKLYDETISPFGRNYEFDLNYLLEAIDNNKLNAKNKLDKKIIKKAFEFCYNEHKGVLRKSGVPLYTHPLSVALILIEELKIPDTAIIATALLYDILRYSPNFNQSIIEKEFGENIANLVRDTANFSRKNNPIYSVQNSNSEITKAEFFHKLFAVIIKDIRIFLVKLCDRLHNIRTLQYLPESRQVQIAEETLKFFTPFAHRLGLKKLQHELESRSFYFYNNTQYKQILDFLKVKKRTFIEYMYIIVDNIKTSIKELNISHKINVMHKQEYEIFEIMQNGKKLDEIDDIFSLEIVLNSKDSGVCLQIHKHLVEKFDTVEYIDLLTNPTVNTDNSVSTELFGLNGRIHIDIRTKKMQENAFNVTIQKIVNKRSLLDSEISEEDIELWTNWMDYIIEVKDNESAARLIWSSIKNNIYNSKITVSTRNGGVVTLPKTSTVIDLAFALSPEIGTTLITCKINGVVKNIFTELKNGDMVEIITSPKCHPDSNWLNNAISFRTIAHLTNYFKTSFELKLNSAKSNISLGNSEQLFRITGINSSNNLLSKIRETIGQENIRRIAISPNSNIFETAIQTNFPNNKINNDLFLNLIKINGVKSVLVE